MTRHHVHRSRRRSCVSPAHGGLLKNWSAEERQLKVNELQRLVAKLENQKERRDLKTYIAGLL